MTTAPTLLRFFPPMSTKKYAILLDAGFVRERLKSALRESHLVKAGDIVRCVEGIKTRLAEEMHAFPPLSLYRVFYYDGEPYNKSVKFPLSGASDKEYARKEANDVNAATISELRKIPFFAVRLGHTVHRGWQIHHSAFDSQNKRESGKSVEITGEHLKPIIRQKGVDARLGLDIASLSLKRFVDIIVLVTGDSDFASPAAFARKEGRQVVLVTLGHSINEKLRDSADFCMDDAAEKILQSGR